MIRIPHKLQRYDHGARRGNLVWECRGHILAANDGAQDRGPTQPAGFFDYRFYDASSCAGYARRRSFIQFQFARRDSSPRLRRGGLLSPKPMQGRPANLIQLRTQPRRQAIADVPHFLERLSSLTGSMLKPSERGRTGVPNIQAKLPNFRGELPHVA